jgi:hypothetical protein
MDKSTNKFPFSAIFNSYVKLPEGTLNQDSHGGLTPKWSSGYGEQQLVMLVMVVWYSLIRICDWIC